MDKYSKAGTLSLHLQKYQQTKGDSPTPKDTAKPQEEQSGSELPARSLSHSSPKQTKDRHIEKASSLHLQQRQSVASSVDLEDEDTLFERCSNLTGRIKLLKQEKYQQAIQEFEEEERKKLDYLLEKERKQVKQKYNQKRNQLKLMHEREAVRVAKGLEDTKKFKEAYLNILQDLGEKKTKLQREYEMSVSQVREVREKLVGQWKRSSNEQIARRSTALPMK